MPDPEAYLLGTSRAEQDHRLGQGTLFEAETHWLLDQTSLSIGGRAVNLGCGPLGSLPLLSEHVGPTETVVGIEREAHLLAQARAAVDQRGLQYGQVCKEKPLRRPCLMPHSTMLCPLCAIRPIQPGRHY